MFFASESDNESGSGKSGKTNIIAGASGYIGKSTVRESVRQGYNTIALVRDASKVNSPEGKALYGQFFEGATVVECDVCDPAALTKTMSQIAKDNDGIESVISCLASRSGIKKRCLRNRLPSYLKLSRIRKRLHRQCTSLCLIICILCQKPMVTIPTSEIKIRRSINITK